jgi:hypothetical protein
VDDFDDPRRPLSLAFTAAPSAIRLQMGETYLFTEAVSEPHTKKQHNEQNSGTTNNSTSNAVCINCVKTNETDTAN